MVKITNEVRDFLATHLIYVATVNKKGEPNLVPKGSIAILDDRHVVFADLYSHQTKRNLLENPNIAITSVNPANYEGYQLKGKAKVIERGRQYDELLRKVSREGQLNHPDAKYAVEVTVNKIIDIGYNDRADKEI